MLKILTEIASQPALNLHRHKRVNRHLLNLLGHLSGPRHMSRQVLAQFVCQIVLHLGLIQHGRVLVDPL